VVVNHFIAVAAHCINPDCSHPYPQSLGHNFCNSCGSSLRLKDRYIPLQRLGVGGFAAIYTVWDISTQTEKVLKVLQDTSPKALELFEQEASVLASLRHPGVPKVESDGYFQAIVGNAPARLLPCLVMEKITGQTLEEVLASYPQGCPEEWVMNWLKQAVDILRELHRRQIIHRDIKPSNLMLRHPNLPTRSHRSGSSTQMILQSGKGGKFGQLVLIDFGGAKQIGAGFSAGRYAATSTRLFSPGYSPPEQITGGMVGAGADFYALGMTCIHLLTGVYPPELQDPVTGEFHWRNKVLIHPEFADLLDAMIHPDVRERPSNASQIRAKILRIYRQKITPRFIGAIARRLGLQIVENCWYLFWDVLIFACRSTIWSVVSVFQSIFYVLKASAGTVWTTLIGALGGFAGTTAFWFTYGSPMGGEIYRFITKEIPDFSINIQPEILLFAAVGWITAWSLSGASSLGKCRGKWAGIMGSLGYLLGWFLWQEATPDRAGIAGAIALSVYFLTVGLGLPRKHVLIYAIATALGTAGALSLLPHHAINWLDWSNSAVSLAFFSLLGAIAGFWLGISHYVIVPFLRLLGWR
jgi:Protein kinase domain